MATRVVTVLWAFKETWPEGYASMQEVAIAHYQMTDKIVRHSRVGARRLVSWIPHGSAADGGVAVRSLWP
eukprot:COSAG01_NODE_20288_length_961_cov_1.547564_1_plen_70_part_00